MDHIFHKCSFSKTKSLLRKTISHRSLSVEQITIKLCFNNFDVAVDNWRVLVKKQEGYS